MPIVMSKRLGCFVLLAGYGLQATTHHLGEIGGGKKDHGELRPQQLVDGHSRGQEKRQHNRGHEKNRNQWDAANQLDVSDGEPTNQRHLRSTPERQKDRKWEREPNAESRKQERQR